ncbi:MAG: FG-GAP-like repeat-containing protein [Saprospiraceae bacterium]
MRISFFFTSFILLSGSIALSQPVIFTQASEILSPIAGFTAYADCVIDMNGDYLDDVVRVGGKGLYIDYQQSNKSFVQRQFNFPIHSLPSWSICAGDIDNNGYNDLLFAHSSSVSFILANENGTDFIENLMPGFIESQRSTMADINNDGWLDAFVCNESNQSVPFRNNGNGLMSPDTSLIPTSHLGGNYAAIWTDYDNDGDIDLYLSKCLDGTLPGDPIRTNLLYRNNHDGTFTEVGAQAGLDDNAQSWSASFEDFDNDGDLDAFVINHDFANRLFRNNGNGTFSDVILNSGIAPLDLGAFENVTGDFNNDGFMDIFSDLTLRLYLGHGDLTFIGQEIPVKPGAIGDLNNDGFLDIVHQNNIWLNEGNSNHWLKINTLGLGSNRNGIGARVEIYGSWGRQIREVRSGQSYSPMSSLTTHFGLGTSDKVDSLIVRWPSGIITKYVNLKADSTYLVPETSCFSGAFYLNTSGNILLCPGDTFLIAGPLGFNHYRWSNGDTTSFTLIDKQGIYFLIGENNLGCTAISNLVEVKMVEEFPPLITVESGVRFCEGDSIKLTSSQGDNYQWSSGETALQSIEITQSGTYSVAIASRCGGGQLFSEPINVFTLNSSPPEVSDVFLFQGDSTLIMATGENIQWFNQSSGGLPIEIGPLFQTASLENDTTYFVESHHMYPGEMQTGGKIDTVGGGGLPLQTGYLTFRNWEPFTLSTVSVYLPAGGPQGIRFIQIYSDDTLTAFKQFIVHTGMNVVDLGFDVQVGNHYLACPQGNLFRNVGFLNYPYMIGDAGQITGSSNGDHYYYYFYDWKIKKQDIECISDRVPVNVTVSAVENVQDKVDFRVYPNPCSDKLHIELKNFGESYQISLFDLVGREIIKKKIVNGIGYDIDVHSFPPGLYRIQLLSHSQIYSLEIVIE